MSLLDRILASKRAEVAELRAVEPEPTTVRRGTLDVPRALRRGLGDPLRVIAEIKFTSPSAGELSRVLDVHGRAAAYGRGGAAMVSVLCDQPFFGGQWEDVSRARAGVDGLPREVPILAKEFILDEAQLDRARATGADAVLLIARIVAPARLRELYRASRARDLHPIVEVTDEAEVAAALECGAKTIGVNTRDLDTLAMDPERGARVLAAIPPTILRIHLSGVKTAEDVRAVARGPADAVLVGEALMREADPEPLLRTFVSATMG